MSVMLQVLRSFDFKTTVYIYNEARVEVMETRINIEGAKELKYKTPQTPDSLITGNYQHSTYTQTN